MPAGHIPGRNAESTHPTISVPYWPSTTLRVNSRLHSATQRPEHILPWPSGFLGKVCQWLNRSFVQARFAWVSTFPTFAPLAATRINGGSAAGDWSCRARRETSRVSGGKDRRDVGRLRFFAEQKVNAAVRDTSDRLLCCGIALKCQIF